MKDNIDTPRSPPDLEVDSELLEQHEDEERHLIAGFRRLPPAQRGALLELVDCVVRGTRG